MPTTAQDLSNVIRHQAAPLLVSTYKPCLVQESEGTPCQVKAEILEALTWNMHLLRTSHLA